MAKQKNKQRLLYRYGLITLGCVLVCIAIVIKLFMTTVVNAKAWNEEANRALEKITVIAPERGSILASNGSILACNVMVWDIKLDLRHPKMDRPTQPWREIDSLADYLDRHFPRPANLAELPKDTIAKYSWHARFRREFSKPFEKRSRAFTIAKGVDIEQFALLGAQPFLKRFYNKSNTPYYRQHRFTRKQPYGSMAHYSIGIINQDPTRNNEWHGYSGLEKDLDSLLYGKPGQAKRVTFTSGIGNWNTIEPVRGYDVLTTIDINIQDMLEQELLRQCTQAKAEWGTSMIMEVATGEIKAISNLERLDDGTYGEAFNRIVERYEPGSVLKPISLMIAFEDGLIKSNNDVIDTSPFQQTTDPHAPTFKTIPEVMGWSSNTGVARIIFRGYAKDPSTFRERWESIGLMERFHSGIAEEKIPNMSPLLPTDSHGNKITMTARLLLLARQAFGYGVEISPLYTLSIYNAIANNGCFVRPHLVRALRLPDGRDSIVPQPPVRKQVCSPKTAAMLRQCLLQVLKKGTATSAKLDEKIAMAGKTGTCYPVFEKGKGKGYDHSRRRYAFAGFFPFEKPKYSCIVLIQAGTGVGGAARISGTVLKRMAERMHARGMLDNNSQYSDSRTGTNPLLAGGNLTAAQRISRALGLPRVKQIKTSPIPSTPSTVPDVTGYDPASALALLEQKGLNVILRGCGNVHKQSLFPGSRYKRGQRIILDLN